MGEDGGGALGAGSPHVPACPGLGWVQAGAGAGNSVQVSQVDAGNLVLVLPSVAWVLPWQEVDQEWSRKLHSGISMRTWTP